MFLCRRRHKSSSAAAGGAGGGGAGAAGAGPSSAPPPPASSRSSSSRQGQGQGHSHRLGGGRGRRPSPPPPPSTRTVPQARRRPRGSETTHTPTRVSIRREPLTRTTTTASSTTSGTTTSTSTTRHAATRHHGSRSSRRRGHSSQPEDVAEFDSPAAVVVSKSTSPPSSLTTTLVPTYIDGTTEESVPSHNHHVTSNDSNNKAHGTVRVRNATTLSKTQNTSRTTIHTSETTTTDTSAWDIPSHLQQQQPQPQHDSSLVITEEVAIDGSFRYFQKGRFLGQGGFSNVYECLDKDTGDTFAIKIVPKNKRTLEMLEMEVAIQRSLKHDHICACIRLFQHVHNTFILLEVCDNRSMDRLLQCHTRFPQAQARRFFSQLVQAVAFMQQHCVLHRDLKAANLFLDKNHNVKVGDFGLARQLTHPHEFRTTRCGTPNYMAPEIIRGTRQTRQYSLPVDVWALGIILYLMLAGRLPFEANQDNEETYRRILANQYGFPMRLFHDVSSEAQELIRSILKTNETQRPSASSILRHPFFCK